MTIPAPHKIDFLKKEREKREEDNRVQPAVQIEIPELEESQDEDTEDNVSIIQFG